MDILRGHFPDVDITGERYDPVEDDDVHDGAPHPVGEAKRSMQVRAYIHWASLLKGRKFPSIEDLDPQALPDFGPHSVLLDFTGGAENPSIRFLGTKLGEECPDEDPIDNLSGAPGRSLLSRLTDHYRQILANQAPVSFEAEFVNSRGAAVLCRGILLPYSSDDDTIDFIYGVINSKPSVDGLATDELLLEMNQVLDTQPQGLLAATGMAAPPSVQDDAPDVPAEEHDVLDLMAFLDPENGDVDWPEPQFGADDVIPTASRVRGGLIEFGPEDTAMAKDDVVPVADDATDAMDLSGWLASARAMAEAAIGTEDRSRHALYAAIGRAYDFSLAAVSAPADYHALVVGSGLTIQDRAPMTPIVKLVFGADYDKTRLTEYATALGHAHRVRLKRGTFAAYLTSAPGGLKGVVSEERRLRREDGGKTAEARETAAEALARKLREYDYRPLGSIESEGSEFAVLVARRLPSGEIVLLGEVDDDLPLLERAARRLSYKANATDLPAGV